MSLSTDDVVGSRSMRGRVARRFGRVLGFVVAVAVVPAAVLLAGSTTYEASRYGVPAAGPAVEAAVAAAAPPVHDPGKPTAVVVVGPRGANVADVLVPYDVLSVSGRFNVYVVAPERRPLPLLGGLDVVPDLTFAQLANRLGGAAPDVTVVPEMPGGGAEEAVVRSWLRDTASRGLVLGVCTGVRIVADAGLLEGRPATSHWFRLAGIERAHPEVAWQRGVRYVDDGDVITTGGLLSSVDGSLRVIERFAGTSAAAEAAQAVGWRHYSPGRAAALPGASLSPLDAVVHLLNVGLRAPATSVGVVLADGVDEMALAAAFDPGPEVKSHRMVALAPGAAAVRSRHGLTFVPRLPLDAEVAADLDHLLVPAGAPSLAGVAGTPVTRLDRPGFAFDEALHDLARRTDVPTARWAAKILEYPAGDLDLDGPAWPWGPTFILLTLGAVGPVLAWGVTTTRRRCR